MVKLSEEQKNIIRAMKKGGELYVNDRPYYVCFGGRHSLIAYGESKKIKPSTFKKIMDLDITKKQTYSSHRIYTLDKRKLNKLGKVL